MRTALLVLTVAPLLAFGQTDTPDSHDHPSVKRWPGSTITDGEYRDRDTFKFPVRDGASKSVEGTYLFNIYRLPPKVTCAQIVKSYEATFKAQGFAIHSGTAVPAED